MLHAFSPLGYIYMYEKGSLFNRPLRPIGAVAAEFHCFCCSMRRWYDQPPLPPGSSWYPMVYFGIHISRQCKFWRVMYIVVFCTPAQALEALCWQMPAWHRFTITICPLIFFVEKKILCFGGIGPTVTLHCQASVDIGMWTRSKVKNRLLSPSKIGWSCGNDITILRGKQHFIIVDMEARTGKITTPAVSLFPSESDTF